MIAGLPVQGLVTRLAAELQEFDAFGTRTQVQALEVSGAVRVPVFVNEFWTAKQRDAHSLHEISYRACFKPQLPRFFVERLTSPGDTVYDPFMGRGTTVLEAALLNRRPLGCDANPLCAVLTRPRLSPPSPGAVAARLAAIDFTFKAELPEDLLVFYHPATLRQICALKHYLAIRQSDGDFDALDGWIQMVALNRLTGHSPGFFSVYTLPPNQAVSLQSQRRINARRKQIPPLRDVPTLILKKSRNLLADCTESERAQIADIAPEARLFTKSCEDVPEISANTVDLVVTSPPFLNVVDYAADNWLRCWFLGFDAASVKLSIHRRPPEWRAAMTRVFTELHRVLRPGGHVAFEVGEVNAGRVLLEELVVQAGSNAGLTPELILINDQEFTKTANCWGVSNNNKGTNTNRIVVFQKP
jgi:hypothetical protein